MSTRVSIIIYDSSAHGIQFSVKTRTHMGRVLSMYQQRKGLTGMAFLVFNEQIIQHDDTPASLRLRNGAVMHVYVPDYEASVEALIFPQGQVKREIHQLQFVEEIVDPQGAVGVAPDPQELIQCFEEVIDPEPN